ncbi:hypothetical protein QVD17_03753 [Tagetes erecta]|uniref:Uncharacterized protein n=1 Tax=Tagetes erecta TaxID=13708 RepID=A0AAD8LBH5_TARER|nr:hypothetical protein QVD17_03753 [Tagetes erecta]
MGMKGHPQSNCGGIGWMMKNKMVMVVVVILVGLMGVMLVQKVKDRRLFNLVIKDKDRQILSLNLLLQKERQYAKENKRKNQDLNAKLYSLRTQKVELNNKIMEMRSTIGSLRDEHRDLELAIDEKQNEIKRKESEIRDLKSSLQTPPKVWSVSSNDLSNHQVNLTNNITTTKVKETGSWFGGLSNVQQPNHQENNNTDVKYLEKLAGSKDENDTAMVEMHNTTNGRLATKGTWDSEKNGKGLAMKGRRFYIEATESQRDKSDSQSEKSKLKVSTDEVTTEVTRFKSNGTKGEVDKIDEDDAEREVDTKNGSEEGQEYKEETEE